MATINPVLVFESVTTAAFAATAAGGDSLAIPSMSDDYLIEFTNGHSSAVTFTIAPVTANQDVAGIGKLTKNSITQAVPAAGARAIHLKASVLAQFVASGAIPVTYSGHDAAFVVRVLRVPN